VAAAHRHRRVDRSAGVVGVLALTMLEYEYFWIASALYLSFAIGTVVASAVKIASYHRGF